jgi:hypothetical protein
MSVEDKYDDVETSIQKSPVEVSVLPLEADHASEYAEYLALNAQFEADPKAYKKMIRKRESRWSLVPLHAGLTMI